MVGRPDRVQRKVRVQLGREVLADDGGLRVETAITDVQAEHAGVRIEPLTPAAERVLDRLDAVGKRQHAPDIPAGQDER